MDFLRKRLPARVGRYLEGVEFPAQKEELLGRLERNGVPGPLLGQLHERLSEGEYRAPQHVLVALRRGREPSAGSAGSRSNSFYGRTSQNSVNAKFAEFSFHALR